MNEKITIFEINQQTGFLELDPYEKYPCTHDTTPQDSEHTPNAKHQSPPDWVPKPVQQQ